MGDFAPRLLEGLADQNAVANEEPALVSVGMPVYNGERWIEDAISSLLGQTFRRFLLVISDNASTDSTGAICERFAKQDPRVRYHRNPRNVGLFQNYDRVFHLSASKYFKWAASADICKPEFLERCVAVLEARPDVVLAYPRSALFNERVELAQAYEDGMDLQDERPSERLTKLLARMRLNNVMNGVVRSDALRGTALNRAYASSDINIVAELSMRGKFVEVPERLFFRRMSHATATALKSKAENMDYFAQGSADIYELYRWRLQAGYFASAWRAPIRLRDKLAVYGVLVRSLGHARASLCAELAAWLRNKVSKKRG